LAEQQRASLQELEVLKKEIAALHQRAKQELEEAQVHAHEQRRSLQNEQRKVQRKRQRLEERLAEVENLRAQYDAAQETATQAQKEWSAQAQVQAVAFEE